MLPDPRGGGLRRRPEALRETPHSWTRRPKSEFPFPPKPAGKSRAPPSKLPITIKKLIRLTWKNKCPEEVSQTLTEITCGAERG